LILAIAAINQSPSAPAAGDGNVVSGTSAHRVHSGDELVTVSVPGEC